MTDGPAGWLVLGAVGFVVVMLAAGSGLWLHHRLVASPRRIDQQRYATAQRLLHELLIVSRRLTSGLDPVALARSLVTDCVARVPGAKGAIVVRTEDGRFDVVAESIAGASDDVAEDSLVARCWSAGQPVSAAEPERWALPLRVGSRTIGVLALATPGRLDTGHLGSLRGLLDERAVALDSALLFDEVRRLVTAEERRRLAREIHDGVAQEVASLGYLIDDIASASEDQRAPRLAELRTTLTRIVDDLRLSIFELRSSTTRTGGLGLLLSEYLREVGLRSPLSVSLAIDETSDRLRPDVEEELLRIVQEAVTNARKHSGAANLWVTCRVRPPTVELVVDDDGSGFDLRGRSGGYGLNIMRERAERVAAELSISERPGGGTRVAVHLPGVTAGIRALEDEIEAIWRAEVGASPAREFAHGH